MMFVSCKKLGLSQSFQLGTALQLEQVADFAMFLKESHK